jgi:hypothetical protein
MSKEEEMKVVKEMSDKITMRAQSTFMAVLSGYLQDERTLEDLIKDTDAANKLVGNRLKGILYMSAILDLLSLSSSSEKFSDSKEDQLFLAQELRHLANIMENAARESGGLKS